MNTWACYGITWDLNCNDFCVKNTTGTLLGIDELWVKSVVNSASETR